MPVNSHHICTVDISDSPSVKKVHFSKCFIQSPDTVLKVEKMLPYSINQCENVFNEVDQDM